MAHITLAVLGDRLAGDRYRVTVTGSLSRRDLRRLEHVCARALKHHTPLLEVRIEDLVELDEAARLFLNRLKARGADIIGSEI